TDRYRTLGRRMGDGYPHFPVRSVGVPPSQARGSRTVTAARPGGAARVAGSGRDMGSRPPCRRPPGRRLFLRRGRAPPGPAGHERTREAGDAGDMADEQPYAYRRRTPVEPDWRRVPGWRAVTGREWRDAQWQRAHCVKNVQQLRAVYGSLLDEGFYEDLARD